jgi:hypothetical protein
MDETHLFSRGTFLTQAGGALIGSAVIAASCLGGQSAAAGTHAWKGRKDSKVQRWDVITIGNLSRNRYGARVMPGACGRPFVRVP